MGWRGEVMNPKFSIRSGSKERNALGKLCEKRSGEGNG
jgi:hypothetical protein